MKRRFIQTLSGLLLAALLCGCVVVGQVYERQGAKAYLRQDYATAKEKYTEAIAEGNADAQYSPAVMYAEGLGVDQSFTEAARLLDMAAAQGHDHSQLMLGLFYIYGDGVPQDPTKGAALITQAAENDNDVAMYYLGNLYASGLGVKKDIPTALAWMRKAKDNGFPVNDDLLTEAGLNALFQD